MCFHVELPVKKSRRISYNQQNVCFKPRGLDNGPKRTPMSIGDAWQNMASYEAEEVRVCMIVMPLFMLLDYTDSLERYLQFFVYLFVRFWRTN